MSLLLATEDGYQEVITATGRVWLDRNLGASRVATSIGDSKAYGHYYQWGRLADGHEDPNSDTTPDQSSSDVPSSGDFITQNIAPFDWRNPQNNDLWQGVSGINNPCPSGFKVPTSAEWDAERVTWATNNAAGAFASPLKLVAAGHRLLRTGEMATGTIEYWSSDSYWFDTNYYGGVLIASGDAYTGGSPRAHGLNLRCIKG